MIAADTNTIAYYLIEGENTSLAHRVWAKDPEWIVPQLWRHEFLNVLAIYGRSGGLGLEQCVATWQRALVLLRGRERPVDLSEALAVAIENQVSAYDAQFIALARSIGVMLVTNDMKLLSKFPGIAVSMNAFTAED